MSESRVGRIIERLVEPVYVVGWWLYGYTLCKHDWRKDELATRASDHPLTRDKKMYVKVWCPNCDRRKWTMNSTSVRPNLS